jgi:hypothetical protein
VAVCPGDPVMDWVTRGQAGRANGVHTRMAVVTQLSTAAIAVFSRFHRFFLLKDNTPPSQFQLRIEGYRFDVRETP